VFERKSYTMPSGSMEPSSSPMSFNPCQRCISKLGSAAAALLEEPGVSPNEGADNSGNDGGCWEFE
jgi:hypothetical protein